MRQTDFKYYTLEDFLNNENLNQRSETDERLKILTPHSFKGELSMHYIKSYYVLLLLLYFGVSVIFFSTLLM